MLHTCTRHAPSETCYASHRCRCDGCRADHSLYDRKRKGGLGSPSDTIPVTEADIDRATRLLTSHGADDLAAMLGLDLTAAPPADRTATGDGPRLPRNRGAVHGERVA